MNVNSVILLAAPDYVRIKQVTTELKLGAPVTWTCESGISNAAGRHTWYLDGNRLSNSITSTEPGKYGGQISTSNLTMNLTADMNEAVIMCQDTNDVLGKITFTTIKPVYTCKYSHNSLTTGKLLYV